MLSLSELRQKAAELLLPYGQGGPFYKENADLLADLCEQVAELKDGFAFLAENERIRQSNERVQREGRDSLFQILKDPEFDRKWGQPRILKASEITEPGWYAENWSTEGQRCLWECKDINGGGRWWLFCGERIIECDRGPHCQREFYGPIPLPE